MCITHPSTIKDPDGRSNDRWCGTSWTDFVQDQKFATLIVSSVVPLLEFQNFIAKYTWEINGTNVTLSESLRLKQQDDVISKTMNLPTLPFQ